MLPEHIAACLVRDRDHYLARAYSVVRDFDLAEDVVQEVCVEAIRHREQIDDEPHLRNWLRQAVRFRAIDALRRRSSSPLLFDTDVLGLIDDEWDDRDEHGGDRPSLQALRDCLDELTPHAREIVELRYGQNIKGRALAERLGRKPNTVFVAISRIHRTLAECIARRLGGKAASDA